MKYARERGVPLLGTCGGYQHMIIEYARHVMGWSEADHLESNPAAAMAVITPLSCSVHEQTLTLHFVSGSKAAAIYGRHEVTEQYGFCSYGLNPAFRDSFEQEDLHISGVDSQGEARVIESATHPFYIGTLFQPERSALRHIVHPLIKAFLQAAHK